MRIVFLLFALVHYVYANVRITAYAISHGHSVRLENHDILFENTIMQFQLVSDRRQEIQIYYYADNDKPTLLKKLELPKNSAVLFPSKDNALVLDRQSGTLHFLFKTPTQTIERSFFPNPKTTSADQNRSSMPSIPCRTNRVYIDERTIVSNDRGDKEANIIIPKLEASTVVVSSGGHIGAGTIIQQGNTVLTNYHVVAPDPDNVYIAFKPERGDTPEKNSYYRANVLKVDMMRDLALLQIPEYVRAYHQYDFIKLGTMQALKKGIDIYTMGHPHKYYFAFGYGMLNKIVPDYRWMTYHVRYALHYSMPSNRGNSGGPIIDNTLQLLGIVAGSDLSGENLNFGISIADIRDFLEAKKSLLVPHKPLSSYTRYITQTGLYKHARFAKVDRNQNGIPDAMLKDTDRDGQWDLIAYDTDEDGKYERIVSY